jgi:hypothetical protein
MSIDLQYLGKTLAKAGLTGKPVNQYSREEVEALVQACIDALRPEQSPQFRPPWIDANGILHIPFDSDPKYHWWARSGQSLYATLRELGASDETFKSYVADPDDCPF